MFYKQFEYKNQSLISQKLLELCNEKHYNTYGVYHPDNSLDILSELVEFKLDSTQNKIFEYIRGFGINVINPNNNNFIHIDPWFEGFSRYRLIFPISGVDKSSVAFFTSDKIPDKEVYIDNHLDKGKTFKYFSDESNLIEIARVSTETPTVIDTQTLHSAQNPGKDIRIIAMIGLDSRFDLAIYKL